MSNSLQLYGLYVAFQAPLFMGFSRQEYWSGLPCHSPGNLPDSRIEPKSYAAAALQASSLRLSHQIELIVLYLNSLQYKWRRWMFKQIEYDGVSTRMQY